MRIFSSLFCIRVSWVGCCKTFPFSNLGSFFLWFAPFLHAQLCVFLCVSLIHFPIWFWGGKTNLKIAFNCDNLSDWNSSDVLKIRLTRVFPNAFLYYRFFCLHHRSLSLDHLLSLCVFVFAPFYPEHIKYVPTLHSE